MTFPEYLSANPMMFAVICGVLGLLIGSFLNVMIFRLPVMMEREWREQCEMLLAEDDEDVNELSGNDRFNLAKPDSRCPKCKKPIAFWENIPVISYALLRGKCRHCQTRISFRYPLVELITALLSVAVALHFGFSMQVLFALILTWALIALTFIDYDTQLLPDDITLPLIWLGLLISLGNVFVDSTTSIIGAVAGYLSLWLVYQTFKLLTGKEGMGFGDFKLLALLGAWLGWQMLPVVILLSSFAGAIIGISLVVFKKHNKDKPIPFGPYLAIAGWIALLYGNAIVDAYIKLTF